MNPLLELVADRNAHYPIHALITSYLEPPDIFRLSWTCKGLSKLYHDTKKTHWSIDARLGQFFKNVKTFRNMQAQNNMLVCGEIARDFFARRPISASSTYSMTLSVKTGESKDAINDFLKDEGYVESPNDEPPSAECRITSFQKPAIQYRRALEILVFPTVGQPSTQLILDTLSTSVCNFISWNKAYCLFPVQTLLDHESYPLQPVYIQDDFYQKETREYLRKEALAGYTLLQPCSDGCKTKSPRIGAFSPLRQVGDKYSWVIDLDTTDINPSSTPDFPLDYATFSVREVSYTSTVGPYYELVSTTLKSIVLEHAYTVATTALGRWNSDETTRGYDMLVNKLNHALKLQLGLMEPSERPEWFLELAQRSSRYELLKIDSTFSAPDFWNYYDNLVVAFLKMVRTHIERKPELQDDAHDDGLVYGLGN
jgi:hypothetical protein